MKPDKLHLGCGLTAPPEWINLDGSWQAMLVRLPYLRQWMGRVGMIPRKQTETPWPKNIHCFNVKKSLPFPSNSFVAVYSSHLLEHLYRSECLRLLKGCYRILKPGGICRAVVPDLEYFIQEYLETKANHKDSTSDAARKFLQSLHLTDEAPPAGSLFYCWYQRLTDFHTHKWMYDKESLILIFQEAGFHRVESRGFLESRIEGIENVEIEGRVKEGAGICVEGVKL